MTIAVMQPYFMPYIGYFQLMNKVDEFVIYDNIQYTKKGWINRNRILARGTDSIITINLKNESDYLNIVDRSLAENWPVERKKVLNKIIDSYRRSPYFKSAFPIIESCLLFEESNLFEFVLNSINQIKQFLGIQTSLILSSAIPVDHSLKAEKKVIEICKMQKADTYVNPIGGIDLYKKDVFKNEGINLCFLKTGKVQYKQFNNDFIPSLSVIDVMMFNSLDDIKEHLKSSFTLV